MGVLVRGSVGGRFRADPAPSFESAPVVDSEEEGEGRRADRAAGWR